LATDSEIDAKGELFDLIKGRLARVYTLEPVGEKGSADYQVSIRNDYFGKRL
jgi:hypothetical protein